MNTTYKEEMSHDESLRIINNVLELTRANMGQNKFPFLFWGYFTAALSVLHFILYQVGVEYHWAGWLAAPLGWVVMAVYYKKKDNRTITSTPLGKVFVWLWVILGLNLCLVGFLGGHFIGDSFIGIIILLMSIGTLASGALIKFKPLIYGSIGANLLALAAIAFIPFEYHILLIAVAAILCDIIPGHLLETN